MKQNDVPKGRASAKDIGARSAAARRTKKAKKTNMGGMITLCVIAALLICTAVFGLVSAFAVDKNVVSSGVMIAGEDMGGKTRDEVVAYLSTLENPYAQTAVTAKMNDSENQAVINAESITLGIDIEKTADAAVSYSKKNMFTALRAKIAKKDIGYTYSYDHMKLDSLLNEFARDVGGTLMQHEIDIHESEIVIRAGKEGLGVDVENLRKRVLDSIKPATQETLTVSKVNTAPANVNVEELYEVTKREPQDARYAVKDGTVIVEAEIAGREIDMKSAKELLKGFAPGSPDVSIPFVFEEAQLKADALSMSLFNDVLGSYSTKYMTSNAPRASNVELAARYINGKILLPGEEFSYNGTVGRRTAERGFKAASVYENNKMVDGLGGGICQTSSTLYAAVLYADLEVTERHEHSLEVSYAPLGMDATVAYGSLDFKFKNNTNAPLKISSSWGGGAVSVKIVGTKENKNKTVKINTQTISTTPFGVTEIKDATLPTGKTVVDAPGFKGVIVNTYKIIYENGAEIENKFLHKSTYTMVNKVVRVGTGGAEQSSAASPSASPSASPTPSASPEPSSSANPSAAPSPSPSAAPSSGTSPIPMPDEL